MTAKQIMAFLKKKRIETGQPITRLCEAYESRNTYDKSLWPNDLYMYELGREPHLTKLCMWAEMLGYEVTLRRKETDDK